MAVLEATKRRNVSPTTSTLHMVVEDLDCSGLPFAPEDGEFVLLGPGKTAVDLTDSGSTATATSIPGAAGQDIAALTPIAQPKMVWSSALRSDRAALGETRVPVIMHGGGRFKTKLFQLPAGASDVKTTYPVGMLLTVCTPSSNAVANTGQNNAIEYRGSLKRLILAPYAGPIGGTAPTTVVGYVTDVTNDSAVSGVGEIEFVLYDHVTRS